VLGKLAVKGLQCAHPITQAMLSIVSRARSERPTKERAAP
jgi:hypothetical protein